jgi:ATP-dependent Zn protease
MDELQLPDGFTVDDLRWILNAMKRGVGTLGSDDARRYETLWPHLNTIAPESRDRAAYHEAGHAVCAKTLGREVVCVEIFDDHTGRIEAPRSRKESTHRTQARIAVAGYVAEAHQFRAAKPSPSDHSRIIRLIREGSQGQLSLDQAANIVISEERFVRDILTDRWPVVEELATILIEQSRVDGQQLNDILQGVQLALSNQHSSPS